MLTAIQTTFVVLKVLGVLDWSWGTVFIPLYIWLGIVVLNVLCKAVEKALEDQD